MDSSTTDNLEDPEVSAVTVEAAAETTGVEVHIDMHPEGQKLLSDAEEKVEQDPSVSKTTRNLTHSTFDNWQFIMIPKFLLDGQS